MAELDGKKKRKLGGGGGGDNGFKSLGLSESVYRGILRMGFRMPTPVQRKSLPVALSGADAVVMARTGSGKTCAFLIPLLEKLLATKEKQQQLQQNSTNGNTVRGIILSPTRELSLQTLRVLQKLAADTDIRAIGIHGGEGMEKQFHLLASKPDIIVATPGRLAHHLTEIPDFNLSSCCMCILDEADRLIEMGFSLQLRQISRKMPSESCQKLLYSATMPKVLVDFTKSGFCVDPTVVRLDQEATVSAELRVAFLTCRSTDKDAALLHVMHQIQLDQESHAETRTGLTLIFAATRHHVEYITKLLTASGVADATFVYGTLDQEARKLNLAAFRSGKKPVLVVTDVAARGIDVPLIDHVVHYHFPPSPKLFVHRSGRAARAGRIGFCWGLVEPDELAYMVDLHLFLGRKLSTSTSSSSSSSTIAGADQKGQEEEAEGVSTAEISYSISEMTPDLVHYGSVPESVVSLEVENVQRILDAELSGSIEAESLRALTKVCNNAMKQYRKTRIEASREGIRRAKAILEGERMETGQRISGGFIPPHPLLIGIERQRQKGSTGLGGLENTLKREEFIRAMSNFRPKETVFEAFSTGGAKELGVVSQVDRGRTANARSRKHDSSVSLTAMKNMRRQMRIAHDKGGTLVVAGTASSAAVEENLGPTSASETKIVVSEMTSSTCAADTKKQNPVIEKLETPLVIADAKRRMSKAERRRRKKDPASAPNSEPAECKSTAVKKGSDFRDHAYFIDNDFTSNSEEAQRSRQIEAAMQPSSTSSVKGSFGQALRIEEAMMDIVGDERDELLKKQRLMRWDKSKRKYVQTTVGAELSGDSKGKRMRLESGHVVKSDKLKLGELYEKWQKKTNRSVGRSGVFDDADVVVPAATGNKNMSRSAEYNGSRREHDEKIKTVSAIRKERAKKQNLKVKNMKKGERRVHENAQREEKAHARKKAMNTKSRRR